MHLGKVTGFSEGGYYPMAYSVKAQAATARNDVNCILLFLVGGPSHLDTWDMKPDAPSEIRGPYRPIKTNVPGIYAIGDVIVGPAIICEHSSTAVVLRIAP